MVQFSVRFPLHRACVPLLCGGILSQIAVEGYEKLLLIHLMEWLCGAGCRLDGSKSKVGPIICRWAAVILLGLINRDKNSVEYIPFALSRGTIDNLSIDNKGAR